MNRKVPCKDCRKRQIGCHSKCKEYIDFQKENEIKRKERLLQSEIRVYKGQSIYRSKERAGK